MGYGSTGSAYGLKRYNVARMGYGSTGGVRAFNGGSTGSYRAALGTRFSSWWQNRRIAPVRNFKERRAQRLATLVQHGQELNAIQEMGSADFLMVPEMNTEQIIITPEPQVQIIEPEVSLKIYDTPTFALVEPATVIVVEKSVVAAPQFALVSTPGVVATVETSSSLSAKMRNMRRNRQNTGNAKVFLLVSR
jgi:hypothetical protein